MRLSHKLMLAVAMAAASPSLAQNNAAAPTNTTENTMTTTDVNATTTTTEANVAAPAEATSAGDDRDDCHEHNDAACGKENPVGRGRAGRTDRPAWLEAAEPEPELV